MLKKYQFYASTREPIAEAIQRHLPDIHDPLSIIHSGGAWCPPKRITYPEYKTRPNSAVVVYTSPLQHHRHTLSPEDILYEHRDFICVYKPSELSVGTDQCSITNNLAYAVRNYLSEKEEAYTAMAISRIDFPVSGLVLFSKSKEGESRLFTMMADREIHKKYLAILDPMQNEIDCKRIQDKLAFEGKAFISETGKASHSLFMRQKETEKHPIYTVILYTGRRQQIRFHASKYLSPIIGDKAYGSKTPMKENHIGLMSVGYNFTYQGKRIRIRLPNLEDKIQGILDKSQK